MAASGLQAGSRSMILQRVSRRRDSIVSMHGVSPTAGRISGVERRADPRPPSCPWRFSPRRARESEPFSSETADDTSLGYALVRELAPCCTSGMYQTPGAAICGRALPQRCLAYTPDRVEKTRGARDYVFAAAMRRY